MFETNYPEINVDELMQKIRREVANCQGKSQQLLTKNNTNLTDFMSSITYIESLLINAESRAYARTKWPDKLNRFPFNLNLKLQKFILKILNFFFKDQREVNLNLVFALKESVKINRQILEEISTLKTPIDECLNTVENHFQGMNERLNTVENYFQGMNERLNTVENHFQGMNERLSTVENHFQGMNEHLSTVENYFQGVGQCLDVMNVRFQGVDENLNSIDHYVNNLTTGIEEKFNNFNIYIQGLNERLNSLDKTIQRIDEHYIKNDSYLKNDLMQQKRMITLFLEEAMRRLPETFNEQQLQTFTTEDRHLLDAFYVAFEDNFRGTREEIFNRLKVYLPIIEEAKVGTQESPILDLGCGRGEWLELLRETRYIAQGIDLNKVMVEQCQSRGLKAIEADAIQFLRSLPDRSLGAITGFHIIEHLHFKVLLKLVDEILRVLNVGGLVILESPNPENLVVGACNFYSDPTHIKPIFPPTMKFILEQRGFSDVQLMRLSIDRNRADDQLQFIETDNIIASKVNPLIEIAKSNFYTSPDFALVAKKY